MPVLTPHVPDGLIDLMKALTKSVLKEKPENIYEFAVQHFEKLIIERDGSLDKGYEIFRSEETHFKSIEKYEFEKILRNSQRAKNSPNNAQSEQIDTKDLPEKNDIQPSQSTSVQRKFKVRKLSSRKPSDSLISIKEEENEEAAKAEIECEMQRREWAAFKIQRAFKLFQRNVKKKEDKPEKRMTEEVAALIIQRSLKTIFSNRLKVSKLSAKSRKSSAGIPGADEQPPETLTKAVEDQSEAFSDNFDNRRANAPLRQNSDDQHPSIAFGERCSEDDTKQELSKVDENGHLREELTSASINKELETVKVCETNENDSPGEGEPESSDILEDQAAKYQNENNLAEEPQPKKEESVEATKKEDEQEVTAETLKVDATTVKANIESSRKTSPQSKHEQKQNENVDATNLIRANQPAEIESDDINISTDQSKQEDTKNELENPTEKITDISVEIESLANIIKEEKIEKLQVTSENVSLRSGELSSDETKADQNENSSNLEVMKLHSTESSKINEEKFADFNIDPTENHVEQSTTHPSHQETLPKQKKEEEDETFKCNLEDTEKTPQSSESVLPEQKLTIKDELPIHTSLPISAADTGHEATKPENNATEQESLMQLLQNQKMFIDEERKNAGFPGSNHITKRSISVNDNAEVLSVDNNLSQGLSVIGNDDNHIPPKHGSSDSIDRVPSGVTQAAADEGLKLNEKTTEDTDELKNKQEKNAEGTAKLLTKAAAGLLVAAAPTAAIIISKNSEEITDGNEAKTSSTPIVDPDPELSLEEDITPLTTTSIENTEKAISELTSSQNADGETMSADGVDNLDEESQPSLPSSKASLHEDDALEIQESDSLIEESKTQKSGIQQYSDMDEFKDFKETSGLSDPKFKEDTSLGHKTDDVSDEAKTNKEDIEDSKLKESVTDGEKLQNNCNDQATMGVNLHTFNPDIEKHIDKDFKMDGITTSSLDQFYQESEVLNISPDKITESSFPNSLSNDRKLDKEEPQIETTSAIAHRNKSQFNETEETNNVAEGAKLKDNVTEHQNEQINAEQNNDDSHKKEPTGMQAEDDEHDAKPKNLDVNNQEKLKDETESVCNVEASHSEKPIIAERIGDSNEIQPSVTEEGIQLNQEMVNSLNSSQSNQDNTGDSGTDNKNNQQENHVTDIVPSEVNKEAGGENIVTENKPSEEYKVDTSCNDEPSLENSASMKESSDPNTKSDQESLAQHLRDFKNNLKDKTVENLQNTSQTNVDNLKYVATASDIVEQEGTDGCIKSPSDTVNFETSKDLVSLDKSNIKNENTQVKDNSSNKPERSTSSNDFEPEVDQPVISEENVHQNTTVDTTNAPTSEKLAIASVESQEKTTEVLDCLGKPDETSLNTSDQAMTPENLDNDSSSELSVLIFEAGETRENEAGNPHFADVSSETGKPAEIKADCQGKNIQFIHDNYETVELKAVEDKNDKSIISEKSVDAINNVKEMNRQQSETNEVPDLTACDTKKCDNASDDEMSISDKQRNDDTSEDSLKVGNKNEVNKTRSIKHDSKSENNEDAMDADTKEENAINSNEVSQESIIEVTPEQSSILAGNTVEIGEDALKSYLQGKDVATENGINGNVTQEAVIEPLVIKQTVTPASDQQFRGTISDDDNKPIKGIVKSLDENPGQTDDKKDRSTMNEDKLTPNNEAETTTLESLARTESPPKYFKSVELTSEETRLINSVSESLKSIDGTFVELNTVNQNNVIFDEDNPKINRKLSTPIELVEFDTMKANEILFENNFLTETKKIFGTADQHSDESVETNENTGQIELTKKDGSTNSADATCDHNSVKMNESKSKEDLLSELNKATQVVGANSESAGTNEIKNAIELAATADLVETTNNGLLTKTAVNIEDHDVDNVPTIEPISESSSPIARIKTQKSSEFGYTSEVVGNTEVKTFCASDKLNETAKSTDDSIIEANSEQLFELIDTKADPSNELDKKLDTNVGLDQINEPKEDSKSDELVNLVQDRKLLESEAFYDGSILTSIKQHTVGHEGITKSETIETNKLKGKASTLNESNKANESAKAFKFIHRPESPEGFSHESVVASDSSQKDGATIDGLLPQSIEPAFETSMSSAPVANKDLTEASKIPQNVELVKLDKPDVACLDKGIGQESKKLTELNELAKDALSMDGASIQVESVNTADLLIPGKLSDKTESDIENICESTKSANDPIIESFESNSEGTDELVRDKSSMNNINSTKIIKAANGTLKATYLTQNTELEKASEFSEIDGTPKLENSSNSNEVSIKSSESVNENTAFDTLPRDHDSMVKASKLIENPDLLKVEESVKVPDLHAILKNDKLQGDMSLKAGKATKSPDLTAGSDPLDPALKNISESVTIPELAEADIPTKVGDVLKLGEPIQISKSMEHVETNTVSESKDNNVSGQEDKLSKSNETEEGIDSVPLRNFSEAAQESDLSQICKPDTILGNDEDGSIFEPGPTALNELDSKIKFDEAKVIESSTFNASSVEVNKIDHEEAFRKNEILHQLSTHPNNESLPTLTTDTSDQGNKVTSVPEDAANYNDGKSDETEKENTAKYEPAEDSPTLSPLLSAQTNDKPSDKSLSQEENTTPSKSSAQKDQTNISAIECLTTEGLTKEDKNGGEDAFGSQNTSELTSNLDVLEDDLAKTVNGNGDEIETQAVLKSAGSHSLNVENTISEIQTVRLRSEPLTSPELRKSDESHLHDVTQYGDVNSLERHTPDESSTKQTTDTAETSINNKKQHTNNNSSLGKTEANLKEGQIDNIIQQNDVEKNSENLENSLPKVCHDNEKTEAKDVERLKMPETSVETIENSGCEPETFDTKGDLNENMKGEWNNSVTIEEPLKGAQVSPNKNTEEAQHITKVEVTNPSVDEALENKESDSTINTKHDIWDAETEPSTSDNLSSENQAKSSEAVQQPPIVLPEQADDILEKEELQINNQALQIVNKSVETCNPKIVEHKQSNESTYNNYVPAEDISNSAKCGSQPDKHEILDRNPNSAKKDLNEENTVPSSEENEDPHGDRLSVAENDEKQALTSIGDSSKNLNTQEKIEKVPATDTSKSEESNSLPAEVSAIGSPQHKEVVLGDTEILNRAHITDTNKPEEISKEEMSDMIKQSIPEHFSEDQNSAKVTEISKNILESSNSSDSSKEDPGSSGFPDTSKNIHKDLNFETNNSDKPSEVLSQNISTVLNDNIIDDSILNMASIQTKSESDDFFESPLEGKSVTAEKGSMKKNDPENSDHEHNLNIELPPKSLISKVDIVEILSEGNATNDPVEKVKKRIKRGTTTISQNESDNAKDDQNFVVTSPQPTLTSAVEIPVEENDRNKPIGNGKRSIKREKALVAENNSDNADGDNFNYQNKMSSDIEQSKSLKSLLSDVKSTEQPHHEHVHDYENEIESSILNIEDPTKAPNGSPLDNSLEQKSALTETSTVLTDDPIDSKINEDESSKSYIELSNKSDAEPNILLSPEVMQKSEITVSLDKTDKAGQKGLESSSQIEDRDPTTSNHQNDSRSDEQINDHFEETQLKLTHLNDEAKGTAQGSPKGSYFGDDKKELLHDCDKVYPETHENTKEEASFANEAVLLSHESTINSNKPPEESMKPNLKGGKLEQGKAKLELSEVHDQLKVKEHLRISDDINYVENNNPTELQSFSTTGEPNLNDLGKTPSNYEVASHTKPEAASRKQDEDKPTDIPDAPGIKEEEQKTAKDNVGIIDRTTQSKRIKNVNSSPITLDEATILDKKSYEIDEPKLPDKGSYETNIDPTDDKLSRIHANNGLNRVSSSDTDEPQLAKIYESNSKNIPFEAYSANHESKSSNIDFVSSNENIVNELGKPSQLSSTSNEDHVADAVSLAYEDMPVNTTSSEIGNLVQETSPKHTKENQQAEGKVASILNLSPSGDLSASIKQATFVKNHEPEPEKISKEQNKDIYEPPSIVQKLDLLGKPNSVAVLRQNDEQTVDSERKEGLITEINAESNGSQQKRDEITFVVNMPGSESVPDTIDRAGFTEEPKLEQLVISDVGQKKNTNELPSFTNESDADGKQDSVEILEKNDDQTVEPEKAQSVSTEAELESNDSQQIEDLVTSVVNIPLYEDSPSSIDQAEIVEDSKPNQNTNESLSFIKESDFGDNQGSVAASKNKDSPVVEPEIDKSNYMEEQPQLNDSQQIQAQVTSVATIPLSKALTALVDQATFAEDYKPDQLETLMELSDLVREYETNVSPSSVKELSFVDNLNSAKALNKNVEPTIETKAKQLVLTEGKLESNNNQHVEDKVTSVVDMPPSENSPASPDETVFAADSKPEQLETLKDLSNLDQKKYINESSISVKNSDLIDNLDSVEVLTKNVERIVEADTEAPIFTETTPEIILDEPSSSTKPQVEGENDTKRSGKISPLLEQTAFATTSTISPLTENTALPVFPENLEDDSDTNQAQTIETGNDEPKIFNENKNVLIDNTQEKNLVSPLNSSIDSELSTRDEIKASLLQDPFVLSVEQAEPNKQSKNENKETQPAYCETEGFPYDKDKEDIFAISHEDNAVASFPQIEQFHKSNGTDKQTMSLTRETPTDCPGDPSSGEALQEQIMPEDSSPLQNEVELESVQSDECIKEFKRPEQQEANNHSAEPESSMNNEIQSKNINLTKSFIEEDNTDQNEKSLNENVAQETDQQPANLPVGISLPSKAPSVSIHIDKKDDDTVSRISVSPNNTASIDEEVKKYKEHKEKPAIFKLPTEEKQHEEVVKPPCEEKLLTKKEPPIETVSPNRRASLVEVDHSLIESSLQKLSELSIKPKESFDSQRNWSENKTLGGGCKQDIPSPEYKEETGNDSKKSLPSEETETHEPASILSSNDLQDTDENICIHDSLKDRYNKWMMLQPSHLSNTDERKQNTGLVDVVLQAVDHSYDQYTDDSLTFADESLKTESQFYDSLTELPVTSDQNSVPDSADHVSRLSTAPCVDDIADDSKILDEKVPHILLTEKGGTNDGSRNNGNILLRSETYPDSLEVSQGLTQDSLDVSIESTKEREMQNNPERLLELETQDSVSKVECNLSSNQAVNYSTWKDIETGEPIFEYPIKKDIKSTGELDPIVSSNTDTYLDKNFNIDENVGNLKDPSEETQKEQKSIDSICSQQQHLLNNENNDLALTSEVQKIDSKKDIDIVRNTETTELKHLPLEQSDIQKSETLPKSEMDDLNTTSPAKNLPTQLPHKQETNDTEDILITMQSLNSLENEPQKQVVENKDVSNTSEKSASLITKQKSMNELPAILNKAAETIQKAFRNYADTKTNKIEPPNKEEEIKAEQKASISIVETNNGLSKPSDSKGIWYVGDDPIIPTIINEKEISSVDPSKKGDVLDIDNITECNKDLISTDSKLFSKNHLEAPPEPLEISSVNGSTQHPSIERNSPQDAVIQDQTSEKPEESDTPAEKEHKPSSNSRTINISASKIDTAASKHTGLNSKSSDNIEIQDHQENQTNLKKKLKKSLSTPCAYSKSPTPKNKQQSRIPLIIDDQKMLSSEDPAESSSSIEPFVDTPVQHELMNDELKSNIPETSKVLTDVFDTFDAGVDSDLKSERHIESAGKQIISSQDPDKLGTSDELIDQTLNEDEQNKDDLVSEKHTSADLDSLGTVINLGPNMVNPVDDFECNVTTNNNDCNKNACDSENSHQNCLCDKSLKTNSEYEETLQKPDSPTEKEIIQEAPQNEESNFNSFIDVYENNPLDVSLEKQDRIIGHTSDQTVFATPDETDQVQTLINASSTHTSITHKTNENNEQTLDVDALNAGSKNSSAKSLNKSPDESPRTDVENLDISVYGEDSLEAMYYSLKKHEILLDKMHRKASVCKSASSERELTSQSSPEKTNPNIDVKQYVDEQPFLIEEQKPSSEGEKLSLNELKTDNVSLIDIESSAESGAQLNDTTADTGSTIEPPPVPRERKLSRNDSYYTACLSRPITSATISPRSRSAHDAENPIELSKQKTEQFIEQLHTDHSLDDSTRDEIRRNMLAYSVSEADSDYCEPGERTNAILNDFNISTAFENTPSTDTDSTIVSAATKIQAGARGFLTRRRLRRASVATTSFSERRPSFGNDAIGESLEDLIDEEDAARRIQKSFRRYRNRKTRQSAPTLRNNIEEGNSSKSLSGSSEEGLVKIIDVKVEQKPVVDEPLQNEASKESDNGTDEMNKNESETTITDQKKDESGNSFDGVNLAARRMTLQRGDAVQRNSTAESDNSSISGSNGRKSVDGQSAKKSLIPRARSSGTERRGKNTERNNERAKRFTTRQRSMPVQIDFEILRVLPRHLRKRIRSADEENKQK